MNNWLVKYLSGEKPPIEHQKPSIENKNCKVLTGGYGFYDWKIRNLRDSVVLRKYIDSIPVTESVEPFARIEIPAVRGAARKRSAATRPRGSFQDWRIADEPEQESPSSKSEAGFAAASVPEAASSS